MAANSSAGSAMAGSASVSPRPARKTFATSPAPDALVAQRHRTIAEIDAERRSDAAKRLEEGRGRAKNGPAIANGSEDAKRKRDAVEGSRHLLRAMLTTGQHYLPLETAWVVGAAIGLSCHAIKAGIGDPRRVTP